MADHRAGEVTPALPASVLPIRVAPGQTLSPEDYHYMVNVRYPTLERTLPTERVAGLLAKVREAMPRMTFLWVRLSQPQHGECFMVVRPENSSARIPSDGYAGWQLAPADTRVTLMGVTLDIVRYIAPAAGVSRTEYRLVSETPSSGRLVFVHYLGGEPPRQSEVPASRSASRPPRPVQQQPVRPPAPAPSAAAPAADDAVPDVLAPGDPLAEGDRQAAAEHAALRVAARASLFTRLFGSGKPSVSDESEAVRENLRAAAEEAKRDSEAIADRLRMHEEAVQRASGLLDAVTNASATGGPEAAARVLAQYAALVFETPSRGVAGEPESSAPSQ